MWVTCLQENLSRGLAVVGRAVASRATLPVTQNVLIQPDGNRLKLTATNLEIAISVWLGAQIEAVSIDSIPDKTRGDLCPDCTHFGEGAVTIPARTLIDFINSMPDRKVEIDLNTEAWGINLQCANYTASFYGTKPCDFPPVPSVEDGATAIIPAESLKGSVERVAFAAAADDSRPVLTGVKMDLSESRYTLAAADGFRLAVDTGELSGETEAELGVIIPARTLSEVQRLVGDRDKTVEIKITESRGQALFKLQSVEVVTQLVQGTFPDYEKLIPVGHGTVVTVDLQDFMQATRAASIFARDGSGIIRLFMNPGEGGSDGEMKVQSRAEEVGDNEGVIPAKIDGEESRVAFNSKFLTDVLAVLDGDEVSLETTTPSSPGVVRAGNHAGYTHVVMPMFVQW